MKPITTPINLTPRGILSDRMCVKAAMCMCVCECVWTQGVRLHLTELSREAVKRELLFSWLLISFIHKSNPNIVARLVLERMPSRKFYHSLRDALVYRHSLPVDSTPSHGLSISPFLSALLCLHFYRSLSFSLSLPPGKFTVRSRHIALQGHLCPSHQKIKKIQLTFLCQPFH